MAGGGCVQFDETALIAAARGGHTSAVEALVADGANVNAENGVSGNKNTLVLCIRF